MTRPEIDELEEMLRETILHEEFRVYALDGQQHEQIWGYLFDSTKQGRAARIFDDTYFFSSNEFYGQVNVRIRGRNLFTWGDSDALGLLKTDIQEEIKSKLRERKIIKADCDEDNMGFPIDL